MSNTVLTRSIFLHNMASVQLSYREAGIGQTMDVRGLEEVKQDRDALQLAVQLTGLDQSPERQLTAALLQAIQESYDPIITCAEEGKPFIATSYGNAPELFVALDLSWYPLMLMPYLPMWQPHILQRIDEAVNVGLGTDMCTLIRLGINSVQAGRTLLPTAL